MISDADFYTLLGFKNAHPLDSKTMAEQLVLTFYPTDYQKVTKNIEEFSDRLRHALLSHNVKIVSYEDAHVHVPLSKRLKRVSKILASDSIHLAKKLFGLSHGTPRMGLAVIQNALKPYRIKSGVSVVVLGESEEGHLAMDNTSSFRGTSVVTILELPESITPQTAFDDHFKTSIGLFAYNMTNVVIGLTSSHWYLYNFNASHPHYEMQGNLPDQILHSLIPKLAAPMLPPRTSEFMLAEEAFSVHDGYHFNAVKELSESGALFEEVAIFPKGMKISDLPFRNAFYRWIGAIHLDNRNGMSYGFLAFQLKTAAEKVYSTSEFEKDFSLRVDKEQLMTVGTDLYLSIKYRGELVVMKVPDVWVLTLRSGCVKTAINPVADILKLGLSNGIMHMHTPVGHILDKHVKASFDTKVILAHALGNAIVLSVSKHFGDNPEFVRHMEEGGMGLAHWHGYINRKHVPSGWHVHGTENPHVACSSAQSSIYAIKGKIEAFISAKNANHDYRGDVHVEPHHGSNITYPSLIELAGILKSTPDMTSLGNKYL